jgi:hypothetical protein
MLPAAVAGAAAAISLAAPLAAQADTGGSGNGWTMYHATLNQLNHSGGSGSVMVKMHGNQATVTEHFSGLAAKFKGGPFPHVQHIHGLAQGQCPTMPADKNGDRVISTPEAQPDYGMIQSTLTSKGGVSPKEALNLKVAQMGSSTNYKRTFTVNSKTMKALKDGNAVVVVHGLDPSTLPKKAQQEKSPLKKSLPLAATAPALCGALHQSANGPNTGNGSTAGVDNEGMIAAGGGLLVAAAVMAAGGVLVAASQANYPNWANLAGKPILLRRPWRPVYP